MEVMNENAKQQAQTQLESLVEMVITLRTAGNDEAREAAETTIQEDPLSIEVRADWHALGAEHAKATEFKIELCTGGPAVRIVGELDRYSEPENPCIQYSDWFVPWQNLSDISDEENEALLEYCRLFYFAD
jgi:hypothetical protein